MKRLLIILMLVLGSLCSAEGKPIDLSEKINDKLELAEAKLDTLQQHSRFARFIGRTYRWGSEFFNGYDTTYVVGTGYSFNAKISFDSWSDGYRFMLPENRVMTLLSRPVTSVGLHLSYLALSVGYDINLSKIFRGIDRSRQRWRAGFNCMLFAIEAYYERNDMGSRITRFGSRENPIFPDIHFKGIDNNTWGIDAYYFFNHKRYSEAATFNFSRIQQRSQGSFFAGISIYAQRLNFNFHELPPSYRDELPSSWEPSYIYRVNTNNYAVRAGYGYNWCFTRNWVLGVSVSPIIGLRRGYVTPWTEGTARETSLSLYNRLKLSFVWNHTHWYFGAMARFDLAIINNKKTTYAGGILATNMVLGYRFNLW